MSAALLTTAATASRLGISVDQVRNLIREGSLPGVRIGKREFRVPPDEVERFIRAGGCQPGQEK